MADHMNAGSPMLVIVNANDQHPFASYLIEILDAEGFFARDVLDLAVTGFSEAHLARYGVVVVADVDLSTSQQNALRRYVQEGGRLVALRPPSDMQDVFGVEASTSFVNRQAKDRYISVSRSHPLTADIPCASLQFQGTMNLYRPAGAAVLAHVAGDLDKPTGFAAITIFRFGAGVAGMFAYDLATSVVMQHQGRPENASTGVNADADGDDRWSPNDLFINQLDPRLKHVPQADVHQDLLARMLNSLGQEATPLPRAWYFPDAAPCIGYFNGDSDGMDRGDYDAIVATLERHGGAFTVYLLDDHHALFSDDDIAELRSRGHAFGQHTDLDLKVSVEDAASELRRAFDGFRTTFGFDSLSHRGHCLIWPGWAEMADLLATNGVQMDQSFIPRRFLQHGYLNGSGRPARFVREDGSQTDLFEQNTLLTDDGSVERDKFLIPTGSREEVMNAALAMLDDAMSTYHGVYQVAFHPHLTVAKVMWLFEALVERCAEIGVPMLSGDAWIGFHHARRHVRFDRYRSNAATGEVGFRIVAGEEIRGLTIMLPLRFGSRTLAWWRTEEPDRAFLSFREFVSGYAVATIDLRAGAEVVVRAEYQHAHDGEPLATHEQRRTLPVH